MISEDNQRVDTNKPIPPVEGWTDAVVAAWDGLIYVGGPDYRIRFMNRRFIEALGRDATGELCHQALHGRDTPCPWCPTEVFSGQTVSGLFQKPLDESWYQVINSPVPLGDGRYAKAAFIRETDPPEETVRNLPVFLNIIDHLHDAIFFHHPESGRIIYVNDAACSSLGLDRSALLEMVPADFSARPADQQSWSQLLTEIETQGHARFETTHRASDGNVFAVEVNATRVRAGLQDFIVTVARDIRERKQAEARLIEERNKLEAIMAALGEGITVIDRNLKIRYQNEVLIRRRGVHLGEDCYRIYADRDQPCEDCQVKRSFDDGAVHTRPFATTTPDGLPLQLEITSCPLRDATGEIVACVEVVRDVTEQKRLEISREEAFSAVSHEMRTPLTAILGFAQFLQEHATTRSQQQEFLGLIAKEGERLKRLIDNLLSLKRLRAGFGLLDPGPVPLYPLLVEVAEHYRTPLKKQRIEIDCDPQLPPVQGEALKLQEVVTNLLDNALKYAPGSHKIILGARLRGAQALLWVQDEGSGIPDNKKEQIFERFYRLDEPKKTSGTGLGLALVREIATAHGGRAWVEDAPVSGSIFYISLPLATVDTTTRPAP